jgi:leucyl aminopeptidase (aminopeptidase T)
LYWDFDGYKIVIKNTVLDEKMKNSYHVAIGTNNMFGGNIISKSHIDFVFQGDVVFK